MSASEPIIDALAQAAPRLSEPEVREAYEQLVRMIETHVTGQGFVENEIEPLTETQLVLLRHGLRGFANGGRAQTAWNEMSEAADSLTEAVAHYTTVTIGQNVVQKIETVTNGVVNMTGIVNNHYGAPTPEQFFDDLPPLPEEPAPLSLPKSKRQHDIFLSYCRKDARVMRRLHADLDAAGFTIWTDEDLTPGTPSWMSSVEESIQSTGCVVVVLTPESKKSRWVERELARAMAYDTAVFPLLAKGDERTSVPLILSSHQWADIRKERDYRLNVRKLIRSIRAELASLKDE